MIKTTVKKDRKYLTILGVRVDSTSTHSVLRDIERLIVQKKRFLVVTPNPEIVMLAQKDPKLLRILNSADIALPDGVGLVWASKLLELREALMGYEARIVRRQTSNVTDRRNEHRYRDRITLTHRVSGVDVMEDLIKLAAKRGWRVFLLGGRPGVAEKAAQNLISQYLNILISYDSGPLLDTSGKPINKEEEGKEQEAIKKINEFHPHLLFIGFGAPKQEKWTSRHLGRLKLNCIMVVGGTFDYFAGRVTRAPEWLRSLGLEWLFRLIVEPWRVKRQLALIRFIWEVVRQ